MARIDLTLFSDRWANLTSRFGLSPDDEVFRLYYEELSVLLTDDEFRRASRKVITHSRFFPTVPDFVDAVRENPKEVATKEWDVIVEAAKNAKKPKISEMGQKALANIGGRIVIDQADPIHELPHLRRQFMDAFVTLHTSEQKQGHPQLNGGNYETN
jgi:hypothetical protein